MYINTYSKTNLCDWYALFSEKYLRDHIVRRHINKKPRKSPWPRRQISQADKKIQIGEEINSRTSSTLCPHCGKLFEKKSSLSHHLSSVCSNKKRVENPKVLTACELCGKVLVRGSLTDHVREVHLDPDRRPHVCNLCEKSFKRSSSLKQHQAVIHSGEKQPCHLCERIFSQRSTLKKHLKTVHDLKETVSLGE